MSLHRRRSWVALVASAGAALGLPRAALAHAFAQRYDLPVPLGLWVTGAALAVALSFAVIGRFVRGTPGRHGYPRVNLLRWRWGRLLVQRSLRLGLQVAAVAVFLLVLAAGFVGHPNPTRNLAPTVVWILWWVGFAYVSALVGNLWAVVNPWAALFAWAEALYRRGADPDDTLALDRPYPPTLGAWPAVVLFLVFAWLELVSRAAIDPPLLALAIAAYSLLTWAGMLVFGRAVWLRHGDPFSLAFGVLARFAPTEVRVTDPAVCGGCPVACRDRDGACVDCPECFARAPAAARELNLRPFGAGLLRPESVSPSMVAFVLTLLATVTFDGFTATPAWETLYNAVAPRLRGPGGWPGIGTVGLVAFPVLFLGVYGLLSAGMARAGGVPSAGAMARAFVFSLVPIAIAYHLAHYFTFLLIQGQRIIPLVSDPLGFGWNLLGTAGYQPDIGIVGARFAWYTAVTAIVLGHIVAVYVAHVIALRELPDPRRALRSQYPMLALMVGYTMVSLWILAQPIVETGAGG